VIPVGVSDTATFNETRDNYTKGETASLTFQTAKGPVQGLYSLYLHDSPESRPPIVGEPEEPIEGSVLGLESGAYTFKLLGIETTSYYRGDEGKLTSRCKERCPGQGGPKALIVVYHNGKIVCNQDNGYKRVYTTQYQDQITCLNDTMRYRVTSITAPVYKETRLKIGSDPQTWYLLLKPEGANGEQGGVKLSSQDEAPTDVIVKFCVSTKVKSGAASEWSECKDTVEETAFDQFIINEIKPDSTIDTNPFIGNKNWDYTKRGFWAPPGLAAPYPYFILWGPVSDVPVSDQMVGTTRPAKIPFDSYYIKINETDKSVEGSLGIRYGGFKYVIQPSFDTTVGQGSGAGIGQEIGTNPYYMKFKVFKGYENGPMEECVPSLSNTTIPLQQDVFTEIDGGLFNACGLKFEAKRCAHCLNVVYDAVQIKGISFSRNEAKRFLAEYISKKLGNQIAIAQKITTSEGTTTPPAQVQVPSNTFEITPVLPNVPLPVDEPIYEGGPNCATATDEELCALYGWDCGSGTEPICKRNISCGTATACNEIDPNGYCGADHHCWTNQGSLDCDTATVEQLCAAAGWACGVGTEPLCNKRVICGDAMACIKDDPNGYCGDDHQCHAGTAQNPPETPPVDPCETLLDAPNAMQNLCGQMDWQCGSGYETVSGCNKMLFCPDCAFQGGGPCVSHQCVPAGSASATTTVVQPSTGTFTLKFFFNEKSLNEGDPSDFENIRDGVVQTLTTDDLTALSEEKMHEAVYKTLLGDYFEMHEGLDETGAEVKCTATGDYFNETFEGMRPYYVVQCPGTKLSQDYVWIYKHKQKNGNMVMDGAKVAIDNEGNWTEVEWLFKTREVQE
jgi:hypothetical protein